MTEGIVHAALGNATSTRLLRLQPSVNIDSRLHGTLFEIDLQRNRPTLPKRWTPRPRSLYGDYRGHPPPRERLLPRHEDIVDYEFLSYTWGKPEPTSTIIVNNVELSIRVNLAQALRRLRHRDENRTLWVDALCISQTDLGEKSQQVQMIGDIVQGAIRTLAWVGEHMDGSEEIFRYTAISEFEYGGSSFRLPPEDDLKSFKDKSRILRTWAKFLCYRDYWNRLWIVQEVVTAKDVMICCGSDAQTWENLLSTTTRNISGVGRLLRYLRDAGFLTDLSAPVETFEVFGRGPDRVASHSSTPVQTLEDFRLGYRRVERLIAHRQRYLDVTYGTSTGAVFRLPGFNPYQDTTSPTAGTQCLDRRDIIYAVLSLETDAFVRGKIAVDYECSIWDLAFRVLKATSDMDHQGSGLWGFSRVYAILRLQGHEKRHLVDLIFVDSLEWEERLIDAVSEVLTSYENEKQVNLYDSPIKYVKPLPGRPEGLASAREHQRKSLIVWWTRTQAHRASVSSKRYINYEPDCDQCVKDEIGS